MDLVTAYYMAVQDASSVLKMGNIPLVLTFKFDFMLNISFEARVI
jgi:hypothetical protein